MSGLLLELAEPVTIALPDARGRMPEKATGVLRLGMDRWGKARSMRYDSAVHGDEAATITALATRYSLQLAQNPHIMLSDMRAAQLEFAGADKLPHLGAVLLETALALEAMLGPIAQYHFRVVVDRRCESDSERAMAAPVYPPPVKPDVP